MDKQKKPFHLLVYLLVGLMVAPAAVFAGGIALYEVGPSQTALASAGWASRAEDASTLFTNPAGMTRLTKSELLTGIQPLYTDLKFSPDSRTTTRGSGNNTQNWLPTGNLYYVQSISPDLKAGIGVLGYFGLAQDYGDSWVGRYYVQNNAMQGLTIQPSLAYKVTDKLSLGVGLNAMFGSLEEEVAVNNAGEGRPDGKVKMEDEAWGFGVNLGLLYELDSKTRFGLNYLSEVKLEFSDTPEFAGIGPVLLAALRARGLTTASIDLGVWVPQMAMFSVYHQLTDRWGIMGDVGWQDWSKFGKVDVSVNSNDPRSLTTDLNFKDTWHFALGAQYQVSQPWLLFFGAAYDTSPVKTGEMSVALPMGDSYRFGTGTQYKLKENVLLNFAYELVWLGTLKVNQTRGPLAGTVAGEYKDASIHAIQLALQYRF
jgi:long-chain fatty acid transport protein